MAEKRKVDIVNELGMHARAAAVLVKTASSFKSQVRLVKDGHSVNAKSIMDILMLAAAKGSVIEIHAEGPDEEAAVDAIEELIADRFGEER